MGITGMPGPGLDLISLTEPNVCPLTTVCLNVYLCYQVYRRAAYGARYFLVYINDLPSAISLSNMFIFVDDTKCCKTIKTEVCMQNF